MIKIRQKLLNTNSNKNSNNTKENKPKNSYNLNTKNNFTKLEASNYKKICPEKTISSKSIDKHYHFINYMTEKKLSERETKNNKDYSIKSDFLEQTDKNSNSNNVYYNKIKDEQVTINGEGKLTCDSKSINNFKIKSKYNHEEFLRLSENCGKNKITYFNNNMNFNSNFLSNNKSQIIILENISKNEIDKKLIAQDNFDLKYSKVKSPKNNNISMLNKTNEKNIIERFKEIASE